MKIGILTHYNVSSHGALLQMYALQKELEGYGHTVFILTYNRNYDFVDDNTKKRFSASLKNIPYYITNYMGADGPSCLIYQYAKQKKLENFKKKNFKLLPYIKSKDLDCVIVGADEVFALENGVNIMMFGHGVSSEKLISYAPSFGQTDLERICRFGCKELIKSGLEKFHCVSVRDQGSRDIINTILGIETSIVCDPALLYKFNIKKQKSKINYIVVYSYQSNFKDVKRIQAIKSYAKLNNCELWSVGVFYRWCDRRINCNPLEMLEIFASAKKIITDTFHGTISAYITQTPMAVFVRNDNNVKLDYLLKSIGLENRKVSNLKCLDEVLDAEMNFEIVNDKVEKFREESKRYLINALKK